MGYLFFLSKTRLSTDGFILDQFPLWQVAKYVQEGTLNGLTQTEPVILVSLVIVAFNDAVTQIIHHLP